jgi:hypothetical protein
MKYKVMSLRKAVEASLAAHKDRFDERQNAAQQKYDDELSEWLDEYGEAWMTWAKKVRSTVLKGKPIRLEDLPNRSGYRGNIAVFSSRPPHEERYEEPRELRALLGVLDVVAGDEVTTSNLRELGISAPTLRSAVYYLEPGSVESN